MSLGVFAQREALSAAHPHWIYVVARTPTLQMEYEKPRIHGLNPLYRSYPNSSK